MRKYTEYLIPAGSSIKQALIRLDYLASDSILFVVDESNRLIGSLTDGDVRRGIIKGLSVDEPVEHFIQKNPRFVRRGAYDVNEIISLRSANFKVIPVIDHNDAIINVINFRTQNSYLPVDALIMAGGRGQRLKPLTDSMPKPMLKVGAKPIIEHNIDRLRRFGIDDIHISLRYMGQQIESYLKDGSEKGIRIKYIWEEEALGTIGSASLVNEWNHEYVLISNSDLITTIDYEDFYIDFIKKDADFAVATIPYVVDVPYAVLETSNHHVLSLKEKPSYTFYSNGGIYLMKRSILDLIPKNSFFNTTDLMEKILEMNLKLISYPLRNYWLDIGKPEDFKKAQSDINHIDL